MSERWPLIGREETLQHVASALGRRELTGVVLAGPAGVGKTRLALECREIGARTGFATSVAFASRAAIGIPLGALAPILPPIDVAAERGVAMLQQAREGLEEMAGDRPLLLVVDDAQLLDDASALLLQQLVQAQAAFVVVTIRTGEKVPDPVVALWKDGLAERLEVGPLDRQDADRLVAAVLGGPVEGTTLQEMWTASEGNALYLREVVLSALETSALVEENGLWRLVAPLEPSSRLTDLVENRLAGLSAEELNALELVAFGEPIGVEIIERLVTSDALEALERKSVVATQLDEQRIQARLAHPLHGEVLRDRTPPLRARSVRRSLADAVEAAGGRRRGDILRIALWRLDAGGETSTEHFLEAAQQAKFANDFGVALRLSQRAYEASPSFESGHVYADVLYEIGETELLEQVLADISHLAENDGERALHAMLRAYNLYWRLGRGDEAFRVLDDVSAALTEPEWVAEVHASRAVFLTCAARPGPARERVEHLLDRTEGRAFAQAALAMALGLPLMGRGEEAIAVARTGYAAHLALGDQLSLYQPELLLVAEALALSQMGRLAEAEALARKIYDDSLAAGEAAGWAFGSLALGVSLLEQGRIREAGRWWKEAAALFKAVEHIGPYRWSLAGQLFCQALLRDVDGAPATVAELDRTDGHPASIHDLEILRAAAWLELAAGDPAVARQQMEAAAVQAAAEGLDWEELIILHEIVRMGGDAVRLAARVAELAGQIDGELAPAIGQHVAAWATRDAEGLGLASEAFEQCGALLLAAEAATAAADAHRRDGNQRAATSWARQGAELARRCEGVRTPGLVDTAGPTPLTKREREIALLASEGLTSREIAEQLFVSVRTIDNHLARVYDKLGVSGRDDLAGALGG
jgi:DNA-binding CsgD family transcriptional regulator